MKQSTRMFVAVMGAALLAVTFLPITTRNVAASSKSKSGEVWVGHGGEVTLTSNTDTPVASVTVPPGSYIISAKTVLANFDTSTEPANCTLSTGDVSEAVLGSPGSPGSFETVALQDSATFSTDTTIQMTCETFNGATGHGILTAAAVDQIN